MSDIKNMSLEEIENKIEELKQQQKFLNDSNIEYKVAVSIAKHLHYLQFEYERARQAKKIGKIGVRKICNRPTEADKKEWQAMVDELEARTAQQ